MGTKRGLVWTESQRKNCWHTLTLFLALQGPRVWRKKVWKWGGSSMCAPTPSFTKCVLPRVTKTSVHWSRSMMMS